METKKLTAKDLMIGDYFRYKDGTIVRIARVGDVSPMDAPIYCHTLLEGYFPCQLEDIEPTPITAEILEKNGWTKPASGRVWSRNNVPSFVLEEIDDGSFEVTTDTCSEWGGLCMIRFVHELQHALRLCGVDTEIVL